MKKALNPMPGLGEGHQGHHETGGKQKRSKFEGSDMKARAEEKEIVKRALAMLRSPVWIEKAEPSEDRDSGPEITAEPERPDPEALAATVLAEFQLDEASRIIVAWRDILGINLNRNRVRQHLEELREWQARWLRR